MNEYDICIVGSGAGGSPVALRLAQAGYQVLVLERGPWWTEFYKDELACCLREVYKPNKRDYPHVLALLNEDESDWIEHHTAASERWNLWNGNCVGGATNFMSGYFHRLKPVDFRLLSEFGPIEGAHISDWPICYEDLEPYYSLVETEVGISGRVKAHPHAEPRSRADFPYPPLKEHLIAHWIDQKATELGWHPIPTPRAILSRADQGRGSCAYNGGYCGSTGCSTDAKGSSRVSLLRRAVASGRCHIQPLSLVKKLVADRRRVDYLEYIDLTSGQSQRVKAKIYVLACQAIETVRLLLLSANRYHPNGLANDNGLVGQYLLFAGGGAGSGRFDYQDYDADTVAQLKQTGLFINRALQDDYIIEDQQGRRKGGTIDFVHVHPAPIARSSHLLQQDGRLLWGKPLKRALERQFKSGITVKIEAFCDWLPIETCFVSLHPRVKDRWGLPVARVQVDFHVRNLQIGWHLAAQGGKLLQAMGAKDVVFFASGAPPTNLVAGGCRFGTDPQQSVLNADCRAHHLDNLYITDGSFMPTGGSVPPTWTIYANAFRVADLIKRRL